jgi:hypothetical protein
MLIEIESADSKDGTVTKLHPICFRIWESERRKLA